MHYPRMEKNHILNQIADFINEHKDNQKLDEMLDELRDMWKLAKVTQDDVTIKRIIEKLNLCRIHKLSMGRKWIGGNYSWILVQEQI